MPMSDYLRRIRAKVGTDFVLVPAAVVAAFDRAGRLLLVHSPAYGVWTLPGGAVDPDEDPAAAATREAREEAGVDVEVSGIVGAYGGPEFRVRYANGDSAGYVMIVFRAEWLRGDPRPDGDETADARFFARSEVGALALPPWAPRVLADVWRGAAR
jgi:8-oxo-dGTP pyrophosphatase MutT (NUDIX family)